MKNNIIKYYKKIICWCKATLLDYPYWRITYIDDRISRLLYRKEANSLKELFGGKIWIDYKICS